MAMFSRECFIKMGLVYLTTFSLVRQAYSSFMVIRDTTFECDENTNSERFHKVSLTDDDKLSMLESNGGHILSTYMAPDQISAYRNFRNLLPANMEVYQFSHRSVDDSSTVDERWNVKNNIVQLLNQLPQEENYIDEEKEYFTEREEPKRSWSGKDYTDYKNSNMENTIAKEESNRRKSTDKRPSLKTILRQSRSPETESALLPAHSQHPNRSSLEGIPFVLPQNVGIETVNVNMEQGSRQEFEYCLERGTEVDGYLHMCTTCAVTTKLPESYWPPYINEALCSTEDPGCFYTETQAHGRCKQTVMHMNVLRRATGFCTLALKDGDIVIVDEWVVVTYPFRVGCECTINKLSPFAVNV